MEMEDAGEPIILCPAEKKEERLLMRRKVAAMESLSRGKLLEHPRRVSMKRVVSLVKTKHPTTTPGIEEEDIKLPNPFKVEGRESNGVRAKSGYSAPTHRWGLVSGLKKRNKVANEAKDKKRPSKEQEFLKLVEGRPIKEKLVRREYVGQVRTRLLNNVLSGFLHDEIKVKEENSITMDLAIDKAQQEIDNASKSMAEFLSEEQKVCEKLTLKLNDVVKERKERETLIENEKKQMSEVKLNIFKLSEQMETMRKCRDFVMQVAPKEWKENYAKETEKRQNEVKIESDKMREALQNYKSSCGGEDLGLEQVLEDFVKEFSEAGPPSLPFSDPKMIFNLFKDLEMKSLKALQNNANLKELVDKTKAISESFDKYLKDEKGSIDNKLEEIKQTITKEEKQLNQKKQQLQSMINGPFRKLVASEDILKELAMVKNVYEEVIDQPKEGLTTLEMLQDIGELYIALNRKLEHLPESRKKYLKSKARQELEKNMKEAEKAERRKKQVLNMVKGLQRAREKPWKPSGRNLLFRSPLEDKKPSHSTEEVKELKAVTAEVEQKEEPEDALPLVWASNHPGPGPYKRDTEEVPLPDHINFYPDVQLFDTEESEALLSESEEELDKKGAKLQQQEEKKIKKKKRVKIVLSDSDS